MYYFDGAKVKNIFGLFPTFYAKFSFPTANLLAVLNCFPKFTLQFQYRLVKNYGLPTLAP